MATQTYLAQRKAADFKRIFSATIFFGTEDYPDGHCRIDWAILLFFDRMKLWFNTKHPQEPAGTRRNIITLSESFYQEIDAHRIPVERHVVAGLAHTPGILDFYLWIVWKSWMVKGTAAKVPLTGPGGLS